MTAVVGDTNLRTASQGDIIQLERRGYYIIDVAFDPENPQNPMVLFNIPDGRSKNMPGVELQ